MFGKIPAVALLVLAAFGSVRVATADQSKASKQSPPKLLAERGSNDPKTELENMQGTWTVDSAEREGKKAPDAEIKEMTVVIKGSTFILNDAYHHHQEKGTLKLNPSAKPKSLDLMPEGQNNKVAKSIYELTTDNLKMCWAKDDGERPQEFATKPGSNTAMFVLKRDKK